MWARWGNGRKGEGLSAQLGQGRIHTVTRGIQQKRGKLEIHKLTITYYKKRKYATLVITPLQREHMQPLREKSATLVITSIGRENLQPCDHPSKKTASATLAIMPIGREHLQPP